MSGNMVFLVCLSTSNYCCFFDLKRFIRNAEFYRHKMGFSHSFCRLRSLQVFAYRVGVHIAVVSNVVHCGM